MITRIVRRLAVVATIAVGTLTIAGTAHAEVPSGWAKDPKVPAWDLWRDIVVIPVVLAVIITLAVLALTRKSSKR